MTRMTHDLFRGRKVKGQGQGHRLINVVTQNQSYLWNGKAYERQTWYTDGVRRPTSAPCAVTSKVRGQDNTVTS